MCFCIVPKTSRSHQHVEPSPLPGAPCFLEVSGASARGTLDFIFVVWFCFVLAEETSDSLGPRNSCHWEYSAPDSGCVFGGLAPLSDNDIIVTDGRHISWWNGEIHVEIMDFSGKWQFLWHPYLKWKLEKVAFKKTFFFYFGFIMTHIFQYWLRSQYKYIELFLFRLSF